MSESVTPAVRNEWPEELAWPKAPEGLRAFVLLLYPDYPSDAPKETRPPSRRGRLRDLSSDELAWVGLTVHTELRRRRVRDG